MSDPNYSDIGKRDADLLSKDYPIGQVKLELKTVTENGVDFTVNGHHDNKTGTIFSELKTKFFDKKNGLTFTQGWTANNTLNTKVELENKIAKGLKLDVNATYLPASGQRNAKVGLEYKQSGLNSRANVDLFKGPIFVGDWTFGRDGFLLGAEVGYDILDGKVTRYNTSAGFVSPEYSFTVHTASCMTVYSGSYYHRVSPDVEVGGKAVWDSKVKSSTVGIEVGTKYCLDKDAFVKAKIDNSGKLSLGYSQMLRPGIRMSIAGAFDTTRPNENAHKLGLSLILENH